MRFGGPNERHTCRPVETLCFSAKRTAHNVRTQLRRDTSPNLDVQHPLQAKRASIDTARCEQTPSNTRRRHLLVPRAHQRQREPYRGRADGPGAMGVSLDPLWHLLRHDDAQYFAALKLRAASPNDFSSFAGLVYSIPVSCGAALARQTRGSSMHVCPTTTVPGPGARRSLHTPPPTPAPWLFESAGVLRAAAAARGLEQLLRAHVERQAEARPQVRCFASVAFVCAWRQGARDGGACSCSIALRSLVLRGDTRGSSARKRQRPLN